MITILKGNLLESKAEALLNTINTKGIMGKGIALQFKKSFPDMFKVYQTASKSGQVAIGKMFVWQNPSMFGPRYIINFPTKDDWRRPSKLEYIQKGLIDLISVIKQLGIRSIAIPPLGCGNGGLDWETVRPLITSHLEAIPNISIEIYKPSGAPETIRFDPKKECIMTISRALVLKLLQRYCVLGYELTLLEVQKLCFFLQEFGEPLKLRYEKHIYGPYADNLRHVLIDFEGHYTKGFRDGTNNKPDTVIEILPLAIQKSDNFIEANKSTMTESLERLKQVESFIEGFETPFGMELLSTVYWVVKNGKVALSDHDGIVNTVHTWNPRKSALMKSTFILKAIKRIEQYLPCDNQQAVSNAD